MPKKITSFTEFPLFDIVAKSAPEVVYD